MDFFQFIYLLLSMYMIVKYLPFPDRFVLLVDAFPQQSLTQSQPILYCFAFYNDFLFKITVSFKF